jgi:hypothetical protein
MLTPALWAHAANRNASGGQALVGIVGAQGQAVFRA